jgi:hypothetical protein
MHCMHGHVPQLALVNYADSIGSTPPDPSYKHLKYLFIFQQCKHFYQSINETFDHSYYIKYRFSLHNYSFNIHLHK